ncbi:MAG: GH92 family glycosyl hydrolase [Bacteroidetes bacterium]|nr:GH92 family glycosyl hydrolase [Bacteroidota bacterium]
MKNNFLLFIVALLICFQSFAQKNYASYVNSFIGTGGHGHTYPGAVLPHGMVQLSPDTRLDGWDGCGGYHYTDHYIYGFTHTHLSGTGVSDYGDILLMPSSEKPSPDNREYGSAFKHTNEKAHPGYYSVVLDKYKIQAELTATYRVGMHQYTYQKGAAQYVLLDLKHRDSVLESSLKLEDSFTVSGLRRSRAWAVNQYVYFVIKFSKPIINFGIYENDALTNTRQKQFNNSKNLKAYFQFKIDNVQLIAKVAISQVSVEGAKKNMQVELPGWNFTATRNAATKIWNSELKKIEIPKGSKDDLIKFYTALYHTMVVPNIASDVDGQYRGRDLKVHTAKGFTYYTVFSLWDTYRAANPLYTIIDRKRTLDYIKTFLTEYEQGGRLPVWELSSNETDCMIGYHSIPVIVDAYMKGIRGFDTEKALEAMKKSATWNHYGLPAYIRQGFIESEDDNESVSKTLEYAYDDWCIAQFAKTLGKLDDYKTYIQRAQSYKNLLDARTGFMRPRQNGDWLSPFDPREVNNNYTEANSWQYSFYVPQDISGYTSLLGGRKKLEQKLDSLFSVSSKTTGRDQSDITGLIGQYAHGNEPSHHIIYLYNFAGTPWKTQQKVHEVLTTLYHNDPDGLSGNEDCGQMSAWYVMSALGFYMVTPGSNEYIIGSPQFPQATIHLENGKTFTISTKNVNTRNFYIQSATLNNRPYYKSFFTHHDLYGGGRLSFEMGAQPTHFGMNEPPSTAITEDLIVLNPVIEDGNEMSFMGDKTIHIYSNQPDIKIYYSIDGKEPSPDSSFLYKSPIEISSSGTIKAIAINKEGVSSKVTTSKFHRRGNNYSIDSLSTFEPQYNGGGKDALIDELKGNTNWRHGNYWQGFQNNDMEVVINMGTLKKISKVSSEFLQDSRAWIIMPKKLSVMVSKDGITYKQVFSGENFLPIKDLKVQTKQVLASFEPEEVQYVKIKAEQYGALPTWFEEGGGGQSHIFCDEITIR